jgi:FAD/FMN-containing dehydrogenase/Fe-S oxidoreductase
MALPTELIHELKHAIAGDVRDDFTTRLLYSTDASIYQIEPLGVVFPRSKEDISAIVELSAKYSVPLLPRGAGSSLAGQAVGAALVLDTSRYMNRILEINSKERTATVEPGVLLTALNRAAGKHGLVFGPDPASADRATVGGSVGNNATGAHSILYGMAADHLVSADVALSDGSLAVFAEISLKEAERRANMGESIEADLYRLALEIRSSHSDVIRQNWPRVWRRVSGYNLNYLLPWSPSVPPEWAYGNYPPIGENSLNMAMLMAGSEGTLGVMREVTLGLVPTRKHTSLGVLVFDSIAEACDAAPELLSRGPSAVELIPGELLQLALSVPAYARQLTFVKGSPAAMLVVEFSGDEKDVVVEKAHALGTDVLVAETPRQQAQVWNVRKMGLGIFGSRPGDDKAVGFVEDMAVPVESLGEFVRGMQKIMAEHGTFAYFYAHASAGCLHIRPILNLKKSHGVADMRSIADQVVALTLGLDGASSGEHGEGLARSQFMEQVFGEEVCGLFRRLKDTADPDYRMNPGKKVVDGPRMDENLRYGESYQTQEWDTLLDFSSQSGLAGAIEMCNGAGVCRKDTGLMCPSFQVTQDEMHSTRGRSNLLRAMISGVFPDHEIAEKTVYEALDLCLACKGCKSECPSAVDVAKLKYEFLYRYYQKHPHRLRDYLFGYIGNLAPLASPFAALVNPVLASAPVRWIGERTVGLSAHRQFPSFATLAEKRAAAHESPKSGYDILFLNDDFSENFHPETYSAGVRALENAGYRVSVIPVSGAGRPKISKGFLDKAIAYAQKLVEAIRVLDPEGKLPVVGVEPSEIFTLRDEYRDFFPDDPYVSELSRRAWMVDEFLVRPGENGKPRINHLKNGKADGKRILLHGQCYQKVQPPADDGFPTGALATIAMLEAVGYQVEMIESGCCGMAGAFGYEAEHYELSMKIGEQAVFPAVREADEEIIVAASGTSCRSQIKAGAERVSVHPITLV